MYGGKVEGIDFTAGNKETLAVGLKNNFDDRRSAIKYLRRCPSCEDRRQPVAAGHR